VGQIGDQVARSADCVAQPRAGVTDARKAIPAAGTRSRLGERRGRSCKGDGHDGDGAVAMMQAWLLTAAPQSMGTGTTPATPGARLLIAPCFNFRHG